MVPIQQSSQKRRNGLATFLILAWPLAGFCQASLVDGSFAVGAGATGLHEYGAIHGIIVQSNGTILVGGDFDQVSGSSHPNLARINADGSYDSSFDAGTDGEVYRLLLQSDGKILVAGGFTNLQGVVRHRIGRLLANGQIDPNFDPGLLLATNRTAIALALQPDGRVLVATLAFGSDPVSGRLFRLLGNGVLDESFVQTNLFMDWHIFAIHVRTNGTILVGGGFSSAGGHPSQGLALLHPDGRPDTNFNSHLESSTVFSLVKQTNGGVLVGGLLRRVGQTNAIALARASADLEWDPAFSADEFSNSQPDFPPLARSIIEQPDGRLVVAGEFSTVGGYWRRSIVRLNAGGRVDQCFDPGLGLVGSGFGPITMVLQPDGRLLVGGYFDFVDGRPLANLARLLPQSDCNVTRVHMAGFSSVGFVVAGTGPPGRVMKLQASTNLVDWLEMGWAGWEDYDDPAGSFVLRHVTSPFHPPWFFRAELTEQKPVEQN